MLAGVLIGPHGYSPSSPIRELVHALLMFGLGLEFNLGTLFRAIPTAGITAVLQCSLMMWRGVLVATLLGWTMMESIFVGALISISSATIIAKAFDEQGIAGDDDEPKIRGYIEESIISREELCAYTDQLAALVGETERGARLVAALRA